MDYARWIMNQAQHDPMSSTHPLDSTQPLHPRSPIIGAIAGQAALGVQQAAQVLHDAGGKRVLGDALQTAVRRVCTRSAVDTVALLAPGLLLDGAAGALAGTSAVPAGLRSFIAPAGVVVGQTARAAAGQVLRGALRAGGVGMAIDGAIGAVVGLRAFRRGTMTGKQACVHTAVEAGTGAVSTATGVALAAGIIALTGGLAAPTVMAIGAGGALATKLGLGRLLKRTPAARPLTTA